MGWLELWTAVIEEYAAEACIFLFGIVALIGLILLWPL